KENDPRDVGGGLGQQIQPLRVRCEETEKPHASNALAKEHMPGTIRSMHLEHVLRDVQTDHGSLLHGRLLWWQFDTVTVTLALRCRRGASTLYHRGRLVSRSYMLARRVRPLGVTSRPPRASSTMMGHVPQRVGHDECPVGSRATERQYRDRQPSW